MNRTETWNWNQSQQNESVDKGVCHQAWWPKFYPPNSQIDRERTDSHKLSPDLHRYQWPLYGHRLNTRQINKYKKTRLHNENLREILLKSGREDIRDVAWRQKLHYICTNKRQKIQGWISHLYTFISLPRIFEKERGTGNWVDHQLTII